MVYQWLCGKRFDSLCRYSRRQSATTLGVLLSLLAMGLPGNSLYAQVFATPTRSTNIALTSDDRRLLVVNRDKDTLSVIAVRNADGDIRNKLAEIAVGQEPRCVAILPDNSKAYVTNGISGTVSVIALTGPDAYSVVKEIRVGNEPRGCALTPTGRILYVANHTDGNVSAINTETDSVRGEIPLDACPNPQAIAITNNGNNNDRDERVFVTNFFAELIQGGPGEGFDTGKQGVVCSFIVLDAAAAVKSVLSPLANAGFTANRVLFCPQCNPNLHSDIFCPDITLACTDNRLVNARQGAYPNQLFSALIRGNRLLIPSIGAAPAPPVIFNNNVQALVHQINRTTLVEVGALTQNLNVQIAQEPDPNPAQGSLQRAFLDLAAIDANQAGSEFLLVSRGGNFVVRATLDGGTLDLGAPNVVRFETGNIPTGVVVNSTGRRAYVNNEVDLSVTVINLQAGAVIPGDIDSSEPPSPNTFEHSRQVGKLAFTTSLGVPDNGIFEREIRSIVPKRDRGKASRDAWSSCASCHPDGLTDNATWLFDTGPRNTIPLDAFTSKRHPADQRLSNWSAVRVSNTEFNLNSRNVQGGCGFASDEFAPPEQCNIQFNQTPQHPGIFNLGRTANVSDALDSWSLWVQTVRTLNMPQPANQTAFNRGRQVFAANCASCHGGAQWTKSQVVFTSNPVRPCATCAPLDDGLTLSAVVAPVSGGEILSYAAADEDNIVRTLQLLEDVGTFNVNNDLELRGLGLFGQQALGDSGFNPPSLLMVRYTAPYLHHGRARTLQQVFNLHQLPNGQTIADTLTSQQANDLRLYVNAIDSRTPTVDSDTDKFLDDLVGLP